MLSEIAAEQTEADQQYRLKHKRQGILALQAETSPPVDQHRRAGRTCDKRQEGCQPSKHQANLAERQIVGHGGNDTGHMRGVLMNCQKAAGVDGSGNKGQKPCQMPIGLLEPFFSCKSAQIWNHRSNGIV